jgi:putative flippase GtrA
VDVTKPVLWQLVRFGIAGVLTNVAGYGVYLMLTHWTALGPKLTMSLLYAIGVGLSFTANRFWVFTTDERIAVTLRRFLAAHALGYMTNWLMLWGLVDRLGYPHSLVQAAAILVVAALMFILMRTFVFRAAPRPKGQGECPT